MGKFVAFSKVENGIALDKSEAVSDLMDLCVSFVHSTLSEVTSAGYSRLYGVIDASTDDDDPLARLEREYVNDEIVRNVRDSLGEEVLSTQQAECWLKILGLGISSLYAECESGAVASDWLLYSTTLLLTWQALQLALLEAMTS